MGKYAEKDVSAKLSAFQHYYYDYGRFHANILNIIVHIICVPFIATTGCLIGEYFSKEYFHVQYNPCMFLFAFWCLIYLVKEPLLGIFTTAQYVAILYFLLGKDLSCSCLGLNHIQTIGGIFVVGFTIQILSHGVFEGRAPALTSNIFLAINAPLFVNIELFYFLFGYAKSDIDEAKKYMADDIKAFHEDSKTD